MKNFIKICKMDKDTLKAWLEKQLKAKYKEVVNGDGFLYAKGDGNAPILLTAHMDTVHKDKCKYIKVTRNKGETKLWSPQGIGGDDRCGIWMIWMIITRTKYRPDILFCEDEEIGGIGSSKFARSKYVSHLTDLKYLVDLDRANDKDAVYYDCGNLKFQRYIKETIGYTKEYGSFTDICHLSPECDRASVNLSCGYYRQHTLEEYVIFEEMFATLKAVKTLLSKAKDAETYDYQEEVYWGGKLYTSYGSSYGSDYGYGSSYGSSYGKNYMDYDDENYYEIVYNKERIPDITGSTGYYSIGAASKYEAIGMFLMDNPTLTYNDIIDVYVY